MNEWQRGQDSNLRPLGYEPNELPLLHPASSKLLNSVYIYESDNRIVLMQVKSSADQYRSAEAVACLTPAAYQSCSLQGALLVAEATKGNLILKLASRLDAFSAYHIQTWLPGDAPGGTTGTPEVCPSRSSRTRESSPQISYAHDGQRPNCLTTF